MGLRPRVFGHGSAAMGPRQWVRGYGSAAMGTRQFGPDRPAGKLHAGARIAVWDEVTGLHCRAQSLHRSTALPDRHQRDRGAPQQEQRVGDCVSEPPGRAGPGKGETQGFIRVPVDAGSNLIAGVAFLGVEADGVARSLLLPMTLTAPSATTTGKKVHSPDGDETDAERVWSAQAAGVA